MPLVMTDSPTSFAAAAAATFTSMPTITTQVFGPSSSGFSVDVVPQPLKITIGTNADETTAATPSPPATPTPSYNVLINGWPRTTHETLRSVAEAFGPVISVNVIGPENRAFVLFATPEGAERCIAELPQIPVRGADGRAAKLTAFPSERGGAVPSNTLYIRNIPSEVPYSTVVSVLRAIVGEISTVRRYDCQNRHAAEKGEQRMHYIEVTFKEIPGHVVREVLCDLPSFPRGDGTEVALSMPLVIKYHESSQSRGTPTAGMAGVQPPSLPPPPVMLPSPHHYTTTTAASTAAIPSAAFSAVVPTSSSVVRSVPPQSASPYMGGVGVSSVAAPPLLVRSPDGTMHHFVPQQQQQQHHLPAQQQYPSPVQLQGQHWPPTPTSLQMDVTLSSPPLTFVQHHLPSSSSSHDSHPSQQQPYHPFSAQQHHHAHHQHAHNAMLPMSVNPHHHGMPNPMMQQQHQTNSPHQHYALPPPLPPHLWSDMRLPAASSGSAGVAAPWGAMPSSQGHY